MEEVASTAKLVDAGAVDAQSGLTATLPRSDVEAALQDDAGADLFLEIARIQNGERNDRTIKVAWDRSDLQELLKTGGDTITFVFDPAELERMLDDPDVEAQGLREKALVITVAAATAAAGFAGAASAQTLSDGGGTGGPAAAISGITTDAASSGVPGAVSSFTTDASTAGPSAAAADAAVPADGWTNAANTAAAASEPADGWTSAVQSPVPDGGINVVTDNSTSGQPGAVSGFATDASTVSQPGSVTAITSDVGSERTRAPEAAPSVGGGGSSFSVPDAAVDAALAGGLALLITGAAFISRSQRRRESLA